MQKKIFYIISCILIMAIMLTGCGKKEEETVSSNSVEENVQENEIEETNEKNIEIFNLYLCAV